MFARVVDPRTKLFIVLNCNAVAMDAGSARGMWWLIVALATVLLLEATFTLVAGYALLGFWSLRFGISLFRCRLADHHHQS